MKTKCLELNKTNIIYKDQSDLKISENLQSTAKFNKPENRNLSSVAANKMMFKHVEFNDSSSSEINIFYICLSLSAEDCLSSIK